MSSKSKDRSRRGAQHRRPQPAKVSSARQKYEKYLALARAEDGNGDHVAAQNYYQHAEHYFRASNEAGKDVPIKA